MSYTADHCLKPSASHESTTSFYSEAGDLKSPQHETHTLYRTHEYKARERGAEPKHGSKRVLSKVSASLRWLFETPESLRGPPRHVLPRDVQRQLTLQSRLR